MPETRNEEGLQLALPHLSNGSLHSYCHQRSSTVQRLECTLSPLCSADPDTFPSLIDKFMTLNGDIIICLLDMKKQTWVKALEGIGSLNKKIQNPRAETNSQLAERTCLDIISLEFKKS
jgi:hypothetical protein